MNFQVRSGEIFGFLGPSGAGKSTLQKILIGMLPKYKGSVSINDHEIRNRPDHFYEGIGVDFEFPSFYEKFTALENLKFFGSLYTEKGIAMNDTCHKIRRLKGNASDKFLEVIEPVNLAALLSEMPLCRDVATTGEKAATVLADLTGTDVPAKGSYVTSPDGLRLWRMPSTSRAYPLPFEQKAQYYSALFRTAGIPIPDTTKL